MVQTVKYTSWGSRLMSSIWGILIGILLIFGGFYLIFWNEGHSLHVAQALTEAEKTIITIVPTPIDPQNNQHLVYLTGEATTKEILRDSLLDIAQNVIKLERKVEMYQWQENKDTTTENKLGGGEQEVTNYTYKMIWSSQLIDSTTFQEQNEHKNPAKMPVKSFIQFAKDVTVGNFHLPQDLIKEIGGETPVSLAGINQSELKSKTKKSIHPDENDLYLGENPNEPKIGDMRISLFEVLPQMVSVIAKQSGNQLQPYIAKSGESVAMIKMGSQSSDKMIADAVSDNHLMTWIWRAVSAFMLIIGVALILNPLAVLADVVPFMGSIVRFGIGLAAIMTGLMMWGIVTGAAWFTFRPIFSFILIGIVIAICILLIPQRKK